MELLSQIPKLSEGSHSSIEAGCCVMEAVRVRRARTMVRSSRLRLPGDWRIPSQLERQPVRRRPRHAAASVDPRPWWARVARRRWSSVARRWLPTG